MAEQEDKTEQGSERRLQNAFDEGQLAIGRDSIALAAAAALVATLSGSAGMLSNQLVRLVRASLEELNAPQFGGISAFAVKPALIVFGALAAAGGAAAAATIAQTRGGFWPELASPRFERFLQGGGIVRLFKKDLYADIGLSAVKLLAIGTAVWLAVSGTFLTLHRLLLVSPDAQFRNVFQSVEKLAHWALGVLVITAGMDLAIAHRRFGSKMRMSKQEARQERREEDGDPLIRGKRRRRHRELAKGRVRKEVPKADLVIVNPTHIAVALRYRRGSDRAPRVVAKGKGAIAELIREVARENAVPIVENIPLARFLHKKVKIGTFIPADTYKAVAALLAFAYRLSRAQTGLGALR